MIDRESSGRPSVLTLDIDGAKYTFTPIGTMMRVFAQERIDEERRKLWEEARELSKEVGGEMGKALITEAYRIQQGTILSSIDETLVWLASPKGDFEYFCRSIKENHPKLTVEDLERIYDRCTAAQLNLFREFQYQAYNPEDIQSVMQAADAVVDCMDEIPESLQESVQTLIDSAKRLV